MAALDQLKRNLSDLVNDPRGYLEMVADRMNNSVMGRQGTVNHQGAGYRQLTDAERQQQIQTGVLDNIGGGGLGIIKAKGGNWLTGSVEDALKELKRKAFIEDALNLHPDLEASYQQSNPAQLAGGKQTAALNNWVEGPLTKYVKRDMATEGDPVRKLAEQGVLHYSPDATTRNVDSATYANRGAAGFSPWGMGQSDLAKSWENLSDRSVMGGFAGRMSEAAKAQNPWLEKLAAEDRVYQLSKIGHEELGFSHLTDELRNALNPDSGLPRNLQLTPEQMQQMGMEKAVRHVDAINKWRAAQRAEANAKLAGDHPAVSKVREYADNNPKGLRWVELKTPETPADWAPPEVGETASGKWAKKVEGLLTGRDYMTKESAERAGLEEQLRQQLQEQLKYEGDTMGHCIGGYCDNVASGKSRIFSLRDAKGEPHVTIETQPSNDWKNDLFEASRRGNAIDEMFGDRASEIRKAFNESPFNNIQQFLEKNPEYLPQKQNIIQIKGKQNKRPNDEYLPFVQDFVKNRPEGGQWGTVGDLGNSGLRQLGNAFNEMERAKLKTLGHDISPTGYATEAEIQALHDAFNSASGEKIPLHMRGFADGGLINKPQVWEPVEGDGVTGFLLR